MLDEQKQALEVFFSYAHEDEILRQKLENHLSALKRQNLITNWYPYAIRPGQDWRQEINAHLKSADIFLLLISSDFLASDYCYSSELKHALERHANRSAQVIPIIARPADWAGTPFEYLQVLPRNQQPIMSWPNPDEAFAQVAKEIRAIVESTSKVPADDPAPPSLVKHLPYDRNPFFLGRDPLLAELHSTFQSRTSATLALSGLGGMGKTQSAIEYAYRYQNDYEAILWVRAESAETLLADFFTVAQLLKLPEQAEQDQTLVIQAIKRWLQVHSRWLLIFDNANDLSVLEDMLPIQHQGHILLTTQSQQTGKIARRLPIDKMQSEHAQLLLLRRATCIGPDDDLTKVAPTEVAYAQEIIRLLDSLPLALDQAGAYIDETQCGLDGYLTLFKTQKDYLLQHRGKWVKDHPISVAVTLLLAFKQVQQENADAADLLRLCVFLDPDAIPEELIVKSVSLLPASLKRLAKEPIKFNEAIRALFQYSLIRRNPNHTLSLHRLVQHVLKSEMDAKTQRRWATLSIQIMSHLYPIADHTNQQMCLEYLPHAQYCEQLIEEWNVTSPDAAHLLDAMGGYLRYAAQYKQAEPFLIRALAIYEETLGKEHPWTATSLNNLARLYRVQGRYEKAEPLYKRALTIREKVLGGEHPSTATSSHDLALLYNEWGRYEEAEPLYKRALTIYEEVLGEEHPWTATGLNNLANLYTDQGRYEEAEPLYKRALAISERKLGGEHPDTATSLNDLAMLYSERGRYEEAEPLYKRALTIYEEVLGEEHPWTATSLSNLARLYSDQGRYKEAEPLCEQALAISERMLGGEHPLTATSLHNLARLYRVQGRYKSAEPLYKRALAISEKMQGEEHPDTATSLNDLALLYRAQGRYEEAEPLHLRALAIRTKVLGEEHPETIASKNDLLKLQREKG